MAKKSSNKNKNPVKMASYGTSKIYKSNQIRLKASLLNTLGMVPGDYVEIFLDTEASSIVIKSPD
jgi:hypothetical protein